jgi:hypothetical protein
MRCKRPAEVKPVKESTVGDCYRPPTWWDKLTARSTRCGICREILFYGTDPYDIYVATGVGWPGGVPIVVRHYWWLKFWPRNAWYHQKCVGVSRDITPRDPEHPLRTRTMESWTVFGGP